MQSLVDDPPGRVDGVSGDVETGRFAGPEHVREPGGYPSRSPLSRGGRQDRVGELRRHLPPHWRAPRDLVDGLQSNVTVEDGGVVDSHISGRLQSGGGVGCAGRGDSRCRGDLPGGDEASRSSGQCDGHLCLSPREPLDPGDDPEAVDGGLPGLLVDKDPGAVAGRTRLGGQEPVQPRSVIPSWAATFGTGLVSIVLSDPDIAAGWCSKGSVALRIREGGAPAWETVIGKCHQFPRRGAPRW